MLRPSLAPSFAGLDYALYLKLREAILPSNLDIDKKEEQAAAEDENGLSPAHSPDSFPLWKYFDDRAVIRLGEEAAVIIEEIESTFCTGPHELLSHHFGDLPLHIEKVEAELTPGEKKEVAENLLVIAAWMLEKDTPVVSFAAMRVAAHAVIRGGNADAAQVIFSGVLAQIQAEFDEVDKEIAIIAEKVGTAVMNGDPAQYPARLKECYAAKENAFSAWVEAVFMAASIIPPGSGAAEKLYVFAQEEGLRDFSYCVDPYAGFLKMANFVCADPEFPGSTTLIENSYDEFLMGFRRQIDGGAIDIDDEGRAAVLYDMILLTAIVLINFHEIPSLSDRAAAAFEEDWRQLAGYNKALADDLLNDLEDHNGDTEGEAEFIVRGVAHMFALIAGLRAIPDAEIAAPKARQARQNARFRAARPPLREQPK